MASLLQSLTEDAVSLVESELPSPDQLRPLFGALVKHVEELETKLLPAGIAPAVEGVETDAVKAVETATEPESPAPTPQETAAAAKAAQIADLQAQLAALEAS